MQFISLGFVTVTTAGTPVNLSTVLSSNSLDPETRVHGLFFEPAAGNTGITYAGKAGLNKSSGAGVLKQLNKQATTGKMDALALKGCGNAIRVADYGVDADTSGDKILVSAVIQ